MPQTNNLFVVVVVAVAVIIIIIIAYKIEGVQLILFSSLSNEKFIEFLFLILIFKYNFILFSSAFKQIFNMHARDIS